MSILPNMKHLIIVTSLVLAYPLGALAESPPAAGPDHGGAAHEHGMPGCPMAAGSSRDGVFHGEEMFGEGEMLPPPLRRLQLSEAQQDKIFAIMHAQAPQAREVHKAMRNAHRGLHELVTGANYDDAKAKALADSLGKALTESALLHARTHHQIYELLTPEQRQALARHAEHGDGGEHGHWRHDDHSPVPPQ